MKICDEHGVTYKDDVIQVRKQMILFRDDLYGDSRIIPTNIQLIIKDEIPEYREVKGIKFIELSNILDEKLKLVGVYDINKHDVDLRKIIARFNNL